MGLPRWKPAPFPVSVRPRSLVIAVAAVGMWATLGRCPTPGQRAGGSCPQPVRGRRARPPWASPQPLDEDVVEPAAAPVHADRDAGGFEPGRECGAGELRALIAVEDLRFPETRQR